MSEAALLDTNFVVAVFANERAATEKLVTLDDAYLPLPVLGELIYGAMHSTKVDANLARAKDLAASCVVLAPDEGTAMEYGRICATLRRSGRKIPDNDAWIAAIAAQYDLAVLSRDEHFHGIDGLSAIAW